MLPIIGDEHSKPAWMSFAAAASIRNLALEEYRTLFTWQIGALLDSLIKSSRRLPYTHVAALAHDSKWHFFPLAPWPTEAVRY